MEDKRGVMGLNTAQQFVVGLLILVLLGVLTVVVWGSLGNSILNTTASASVTNESGWGNTTGYTLTYNTVGGFSNPTITDLWNRTSNTIINTGNITVNATGYVTNASATEWDNLSISYSYDYTIRSNSGLIVGNATSGVIGLFANVPTWLVLVGVVIIILIIAAVIVVINRFGSSSGDF